MAHPDPEFRSLETIRASLLSSVAGRAAVPNPSPDFRAVTADEKRRVAEVEARMKEIDADALSALISAVKAEPAEAPVPAAVEADS